MTEGHQIKTAVSLQNLCSDTLIAFSSIIKDVYVYN